MLSITDELKKRSIPFSENVPLSELTTFKIGGPAALVIEPETEDQCADVIRLAKKRHIRFCF